MIGTPVIPSGVRTRLDSGLRHFKKHRRCLTCDILSRDREESSRIIAEDRGFLILAPYASRFPFEAVIAPLEHQPRFGDLSDGDLGVLAGLMKD